MMKTANLKIKMTRKMTKLLLLQKLRKRGIGVNEVEEYARKEIGRGKGGGERFKQVRRVEIVRVLMRSKVRSAEVELEETRRQFLKVDGYLKRRWGQHREAMSRYSTILQAEVRREWEDRRGKCRDKIDHLERKWVRARREQPRPEPEREENHLEGILYRDVDLRRRAEEEGRDLDQVRAPHWVQAGNGI